MAHFALVDQKNIVQNVVVVDDSDCNGGNFPESDEKGNIFLNSIGLNGNWKQTSYNRNFRKNFAGTGMIYSQEADLFYYPQPFPSWILNENYDWISPVPKPEEGVWAWNEENQEWEEIVSE
jgi:hypothetical protein